jgi:hypothetical protein
LNSTGSWPIILTDPENGGFFMTADDHEALIAREKPAFDGALPSGNAVALMNLLRLNALTLDPSYLKRAKKGFSAFSTIVEANPSAFGEMLLALEALVASAAPGHHRHPGGGDASLTDPLRLRVSSRQPGDDCARIKRCAIGSPIPLVQGKNCHRWPNHRLCVPKWGLPTAGYDRGCADAATERVLKRRPSNRAGGLPDG